jgi:hypothetical protein
MYATRAFLEATSNTEQLSSCIRAASYWFHYGATTAGLRRCCVRGQLGGIRPDEGEISFFFLTSGERDPRKGDRSGGVGSRGPEGEGRSLKCVAKAENTREGEDSLSIIRDMASNKDSGAYRCTRRRMYLARRAGSSRRKADASRLTARAWHHGGR